MTVEIGQKLLEQAQEKDMQIAKLRYEVLTDPRELEDINLSLYTRTKKRKQNSGSC